MPTETTSRNVTRKWEWGWDVVKCSGVRTWEPRGVWGNYSRPTFEKSRTWARTPNFRVLKSQGKHLPDNPYSFSEARIHDELIELNYYETIGTCMGNPNTEYLRIYRDYLQTVYLPWSKGSVVMTDSALRAKLIDKAKGAEWSAPVFVGESRVAVRMVTNVVRTLSSTYRNLRRGNISGALANLGIQGDNRATARYNRQYGRDPTRAAANAWLALTYGWTPLLNDVKNAAETLAEHNLREENRELVVRGRTHTEDRVSTPNFGVSTSPNIKCTRTLETHETRRGKWKLKPTQWDTLGSIGLLNPLSVAWELLPLSFVADWFIPFGRYLEGLDVNMRFQHLGGSLGYRRWVKTIYTNWIYEGQPSQSGGVYNTTYVEVNRSPLTSAPSLGLDSVIFEPKIGAARLTSAISLLRQTMSR